MKFLSALLACATAVAAVFLSLPAHAAGDSATLQWANATTFQDGTPLAATDIKETLIQWRRPGNATVVGSVRVAAPANSTVVQGLVCGNFEFTGVTILKVNSTASSESTPPAPYATGIQCKPNPPTGLGAS
jgi:hypothetical protein